MAIKIRRGLIANLPAGATEDGELRYATDTQELYIDNGVGNVKIGGDPADFPVSTAQQVAINGKEAVGVAAAGDSNHLAAFTHSDIAHANRAALDAVTSANGANTGDNATNSQYSGLAASKQDVDADLTAIAGLTATTNNFIVSVENAWASRTPAQVRSTLNVADGATANSADATLLARANHTGTQAISTTISGLGTGVATALAINVGDAGAPLVRDGVLGTPSSGSAANLTSFPTLNQNTTGTAAGLSATLVVGSGGTGVATSTGSGANVLGTNPTIVKPVLDATNPSAQTYSPAAAGTATIDLSLSNTHRVTMPAGNITIALSNDTNAQKFLIAITQDGVGSRSVTWMSTIKWAGGSAPVLTATANKRDMFGFERTGAGAYDGFVVGSNI